MYSRLSSASSHDLKKNLIYSHVTEGLVYAFLIATLKNGGENAEANKVLGVDGKCIDQEVEKLIKFWWLNMVLNVDVLNPIKIPIFTFWDQSKINRCILM